MKKILLFIGLLITITNISYGYSKIISEHEAEYFAKRYVEKTIYYSDSVVDTWCWDDAVMSLTIDEKNVKKNLPELLKQHLNEKLDKNYYFLESIILPEDSAALGDTEAGVIYSVYKDKKLRTKKGIIILTLEKRSNRIKIKDIYYDYTSIFNKNLISNGYTPKSGGITSDDIENIVWKIRKAHKMYTRNQLERYYWKESKMIFNYGENKVFEDDLIDFIKKINDDSKFTIERNDIKLTHEDLSLEFNKNNINLLSNNLATLKVEKFNKKGKVSNLLLYIKKYGNQTKILKYDFAFDKKYLERERSKIFEEKNSDIEHIVEEKRFWKNGRYITHSEDCQAYFNDPNMKGWEGNTSTTSNCGCRKGYKLNSNGNRCLSESSEFASTPSDISDNTNLKNDKLRGQRCPVQLIINQNLRAPKVGYVRNGYYDWYTKSTVTDIKILQKHLNRLGFSAGKVDGVIGPNTRGAILRLQKYLGTKADGYIGPNTRALLNNSCTEYDFKTNEVKNSSLLDNTIYNSKTKKIDSIAWINDKTFVLNISKKFGDKWDSYKVYINNVLPGSASYTAQIIEKSSGEKNTLVISVMNPEAIFNPGRNIIKIVNKTRDHESETKEIFYNYSLIGIEDDIKISNIKPEYINGDVSNLIGYVNTTNYLELLFQISKKADFKDKRVYSAALSNDVNEEEGTRKFIYEINSENPYFKRQDKYYYKACFVLDEIKHCTSAKSFVY